MEEVLFDSKFTPIFLKTDQISSILHEEVVSFEKAVDSYFTENQHLLDSLVNMIQSSLKELLPDAEVNIIYPTERIK